MFMLVCSENSVNSKQKVTLNIEYPCKNTQSHFLSCLHSQKNIFHQQSMTFILEVSIFSIYFFLKMFGISFIKITVV